MRNNPIYIVDIFTDIVQSVSDELESTIGKVYFIYGHPLEAVNTLLEMTQNPTSAAKKYPLVYLYMDFDEVHDGGIEQAFELSLHIAIATWTKPGLKASERYDLTFKPTLYPIYDELMHQIARSGYFLTYSMNKIPHTKTDRPYWAVNNGRSNVADDWCDVIELTNLKLKVNFIFCES